MGPGSSSVVCSNRTRGNRENLQRPCKYEEELLSYVGARALEQAA